VFQNGPNWGKDVFMPLDWIIGGPKMAGQGWRMLMECLAAGRSISLPSSSTGLLQARGARDRRVCARAQPVQEPIGKFEGIEEPLARIGANLYMMDAARTMTAGAVDLGEKPSSSPRSSSITSPSAARGRQRRDGHPRRQGDLLGRTTSWDAAISSCRSRSRWKAPTSSRAT